MFFSYSCLPVPGVDLNASDPERVDRHRCIAEMLRRRIHPGEGLVLPDLGLGLRDQGWAAVGRSPGVAFSDAAQQGLRKHL